MTAAETVLDTRAIMTIGLSHQQLVLAVALDPGDRYIPLIAATRRPQVVGDRLDVLEQVAAHRTRSAVLR